MSNTYQEWDDEDEDLELEDSKQRQGSDSDLLKQLRKELKTKTKILSEMETQLSGIKSEQRQNVIKSVLESKGVTPKIAKFIPADIEASPEALDNWIQENADVFGLTVQSPSETQPNLATLRQIDSVTANAQSPAGLDDIYLRLQNAESAEEITNMIFQQGGEV
jgi:hypothetical protein